MNVPPMSSIIIFEFPVNMIFTKSSQVTGGFWFTVGVIMNSTQCSITRLSGATATTICSVVGFVVFVSLPIVSPAEYGTLVYTTIIASIGNWFPIVNGLYSEIQQSTLVHNEQLALQIVARQTENIESDRILLHIVKNNVVDAEHVLHVIETEGISRKLIQHAKGLLVRSASRCTLREVVRSMGGDTYISEGEDVALKSFCEKLLLGQFVPLYLEDCPDMYVNLDATACSIILENGIANAIRHHDPDRPGIAMHVRWSVEEGKITFSIVNQVKDGVPHLKWETGNHNPTMQPRVSYKSTNSNTGLGLRHITLAARACGGMARLYVLDGLATFNFTVPCTIIRETKIPVLEHNLRIFFVDDSMIARKSAATLLPSAANNATVTVFGQSISDINLFRHTVSQSIPDMVILDQNIDFGNTLILGTDLISEIKQSNNSYGRTTFAIRSANCTAKDRLPYMSSGADCVVNKEMDWKSVCCTLASVHNSKIQELPSLSESGTAVEFLSG